MTKPTTGLESIPGVGASIAADLRQIGITRPSCLVGKNPQRLYDKLCAVHGTHIDRCMLYVLRCAVYYVTTPPKHREAKKCLWWQWKD